MPEEPDNPRENLPARPIEDVVRQDGRYPFDAFRFLKEGLDRAVTNAHGPAPAPEVRRHVTGQQICHALRELAMEQWGMLARTVLARWNIRTTMDFGNMVYLLIGSGHMSKTEEDSIEDFRDVFRFDQALTVKDEFDLKE